MSTNNIGTTTTVIPVAPTPPVSVVKGRRRQRPTKEQYEKQRQFAQSISHYNSGSAIYGKRQEEVAQMIIDEIDAGNTATARAIAEQLIARVINRKLSVVR